MKSTRLLIAAALALALAGSFLWQGSTYAAEPNPNGKHGGILRGVLRENWPVMSIHEEATISAVWPIAPMYNNLVIFDPFRPVESTEHLVGELATSWSWSDGGKKLTFKLRHGVKWHDGKPFTSADVKHTFDVVRGASEKRLKLNPRKTWYENVTEITTNGDYEVTFVLKVAQPSLLAMLSSGYSPVYPAHIEPQELRTHAVGTGPFRLKEALPDQQMVLERNPDYFIKDRPYLDGIVYTVIKSRPSEVAALQAGQVDMFFPGEGTKSVRDTIAQAVPTMVIHPVAQNVYDNVLLNITKPPFDNIKLRQAVSYALHREDMIKSVHQGAAIESAALLPAPYGEWGIGKKELAALPGYGDVEKDRAQARKLLAEAGHGPNNPLKVTVSTRAVAIYVDTAVWVIDQLKRVGIEGTLEQVETGVWHPRAARREFEIGTNLTGTGIPDPDGNFIENFTCKSPRNYTGYCNPEVEAMIFKASAETDHKKRLELVHEIDKRLQVEVARPVLAHRMDYFMFWPYVKNLVPHHNIYNWGRMQDVWLDK